MLCKSNIVVYLYGVCIYTFLRNKILNKKKEYEFWTF